MQNRTRFTLIGKTQDFGSPINLGILFDSIYKPEFGIGQTYINNQVLAANPFWIYRAAIRDLTDTVFLLFSLLKNTIIPGLNIFN
ncbi:hypothetical protein CQA01_47400 [Cyclobacterium qasimii]|uniref:Uncharacterized protein n=1 Tax=Cyclobacterium qasimii TaxID=1350429 RepID=A0A512CJ22_9BACT|nr:hypothetical protein CQA01_47400 [Cyclobacterium qasimii]